MSVRAVKEIRVPPKISDPLMRKHTVSIEPLDEDETHAADTAEKQTEDSAPGANTSTMLIVVFALVVICLIAMIVWMVMKQTNDTKDEQEVKSMVQPHPHIRNSMPVYPPQYYPQQYHPTQQMQQQQPPPQRPPQSNDAPVETTQADQQQLQNVATKMNQIHAELQPASRSKKVSKPVKKPGKTATVLAPVNPVAPVVASSSKLSVIEENNEESNDVDSTADESVLEEN